MEYKPPLPPHTRHLVPGECIQVGDLVFLPDGWTPVKYSIGREICKADFVCRPIKSNPRLLELGDTIVEGDMFFSREHRGWIPAYACMHGQKVSTEEWGCFGRFKSVALKEGINPKDAVAAAKPDLYLVPPALVIWVAKCMENGAKKYSKANWRDENQKVRMTVYISAALRHLMALADGEDNAPDTGLPHAAHAAASLGILLDAQGCGTLIDDRSKPGPAAKLLEQLTEKTK